MFNRPTTIIRDHSTYDHKNGPIVDASWTVEEMDLSTKTSIPGNLFRMHSRFLQGARWGVSILGMFYPALFFNILYLFFARTAAIITQPPLPPQLPPTMITMTWGLRHEMFRAPGIFTHQPSLPPPHRHVNKQLPGQSGSSRRRRISSSGSFLFYFIFSFY